MKPLLPLSILLYSLLLCAFTCHANTQKLAEINAEWKNYPQLLSGITIDKTPATETAWIQLHLTLVEQQIRQSIPSSNLTPQQKVRKLAALNELKRYIAEAKFPINEKYSYRTPIFIDAYNNFCAVGYLLKQTGQEPLARKISRDNNLIYVRNIQSDALLAWANEYGFSVDELAWIQPSYVVRPGTFLSMIGGGVNNEVKSLYVDSARGRLYVGGRFEVANYDFLALGIGRYNLKTEGWDSIPYAAKGSINRIVNYKDTIFLGGRFEAFPMYDIWSGYNVAMIVNDSIQRCGVLDGTIYDMIEYKGSLYAAGNFTSGTARNVARWNGHSWDSLAGNNINGTINALTIHADKLILGGDFILDADSSITNMVAYSDSGFSSLGAAFPYRVNDVVSDNGNLLLVTDAFIDDDTSGLWLLNSCLWYPVLSGAKFSGNYGNITSFKSFHYDMRGRLFISGLFNIPITDGSGVGTSYIGTNLMTIKSVSGLSYQNARGQATLDGVVNAFVRYNNRNIIGGSFARNSTNSFSYVTLNGLAYFDETEPTGISEINELEIGLYPNPASSSVTITLPVTDNTATADIFNLQGQWIQNHTLNSNSNLLQLGNMPAGMYMVKVVSENGIGQKRLVKY